MAASFHFEHSVAFSPENSAEILRGIPALPGVFALHGPNAVDEPYLTRAADLRRRITRMLAPPEVQAKRLNLRDRVARIEFTVTGSEFESTLCLYHATAAIFGLERARRRLKLRTPYFLRFTAENAHPRVYSTNRLSKRGLDNLYGPFPSRASAERYCDAVLDLFKLRRCYEDLQPYAEHPGCVYQEMKKCLAPCNQAHTPEGAEAYSAESAAVKRFFDTHGESMIIVIGLDREEASAAMEFEKAAALHTQWHKVKAAQALADELVQPVPKLRALLLQKAVVEADETNPEAAVFLLQSGCISGPERLSTLGVRAVKEQTSVGSSLFAQPLMLRAVPLDDPIARAAHGEPNNTEESNVAFDKSAESAAIPAEPHALNPEARASAVIARLESQEIAPVDIGTLSDHLSLLRRWYYRPEKQRVGEILFPKEDASWPVRRLLNAAARAVLGTPRAMAETQRDLAERNDAEPELKPVRTKILHEGRPDVERVVPVIDKPRTYKSRRKSAGTNGVKESQK